MSGKVLKLREIGDPILKQVCKQVYISKKDKKVKEVMANLKTTFEYVGGFGIAAPQIGEDLRIIVIGVDKEKCRYEGAEDVPTTVMINPVISILDEEKTLDYEGCFSVPVIRGQVGRYKKIKVDFYDEKYKSQSWTVEGYTARLIQHECDHLDGIVFMQKVEDMAGVTTIDNLNNFIKNDKGK
ncbi:MAG: peptide deformylase [Clostridia bacterium]|nr:peptide deformylase [Clostridia bacterium]